MYFSNKLRIHKMAVMKSHKISSIYTNTKSDFFLFVGHCKNHEVPQVVFRKEDLGINKYIKSIAS